MPLPTRDVQWPPADTVEPGRLYDRWSAWYSGDPNRLAAHYTATTRGREPRNRPGQLRGGVVGTVSRWFWGQPTVPGQTSARLHVPVAGDVAATSADLLFGDEVDLTIGNGKGPAQKRLDELGDEAGLHSTFLEAAETCAALGGVYLRVGYDTALASHPLVDVVPPDAAAPEWRSGRLTAVTFWRVVDTPAPGIVLRHLERHEPGAIWHGLYQGKEDALGRAIPLTDHPATAPYAAQLDETGAITTGSPYLTAVYVPNMRPHRLLRGTPLGRSDYAGVEGLLDSLDEAWTSWLRDLRLGKARLVVPTYMLTDLGPGNGAAFNAEQEVYQGLNMMGDPSNPQAAITPVQFAIRVDEHERTTRALFDAIVRGAGYSARTFGEAGEVAVTAREVVSGERRTSQTRARKIGYWSAQLARLVEVLLWTDVQWFGTPGITPERPTVEFGEPAPDPEQQARTLQLLDQAAAISTETKVDLLHPDWSDDERAAEVRRLRDEQAAAEPPATIYGGALEQDGGPPRPGDDGEPDEQ